ncbi:hypothetical protein [Chenggangzhangella methanolivorans]|uniref:Uncharacterized protein n=1 Tax=Chenggangzhangella methanolivorans TaxID=1437009 RepID=A0A9E6UNP4_9HYPH|nr:hypothetical protein [Chenggangzhangella methanolivorans]QZO01351.1 hypothetical protein K6K41_07735 [Chenggangzhangella methanolivorans]
MDSDPTKPAVAADREQTEAAAVRHLFRNQIQAMTSLVGLFGRKLPPGEGRDAFMDLRARFEAATFGPADDALPDQDGRFEIDLAEVARRVAGHLDPNFRHRLAIAGSLILADPKRASALAQILAELVVDLFRNGFADGRTGAAEIVISGAADGSLMMRAVQTAPADASPRRDRSDLGAAIADSLARSLGGSIARAADGPLSSEVTIPAERASR